MFQFTEGYFYHATQWHSILSIATQFAIPE